MLRLAAILSVAAAFAGCSEGISQPVAATVLGLDGACLLQHAGQSPQRLDSASHPAAGDVIATASGVARLALLPNALVEIAPETKLALRELAFEKDGNETGDNVRRRIAHLSLFNGSLRVAQERRDVAAAPSLLIQTPHGTTQSSFDCVFALATNQEQTRITCASGWVYFKPERADAERIEPGYVLEVAGTAPPKIFAAETDADSQNTIAELIRAEQELTRLRDSQRDAPPPWKVGSGR